MASDIDVKIVLVKEALDEEKDTNRSLLEFYESNLTHLNAMFLKDISYLLLHDIARSLHKTMFGGEIKCIKFLANLGITDNDVISDILFISKELAEYPIYYAFRTELQHQKRFGDVISVMIECERYDVLRKIKKDVENLLNPKPSAPEYENDFNTCLKYDEKTEHVKTTEKENCTLEKSCINSSNNFSCSKSITRKTRNNNGIPMQPNIYNKITALLLHAETEAEIAKKLSALFYKENVIVKSYSELDNLFGPDAIPTILRKVDFIVPIVSDSFMKLIDPFWESTLKDEVFSIEEDSQNDSYVPYIYNLLNNEFIHFNKCHLNLRVKPFKMPSVKRNRLIYEPLLINSVPLSQNPKDIPKRVKMLTNILKKTKLLREGI